MRRRLLVVVGALWCIAGCRNEGGAPSALTIQVQGDENVFSLAWDVPPKFLIFLPLVAKNADGAMEGVLARRWEYSPDYRNWTVHLRTDVRWHDGVRFTAHDVAFTLGLLSHPAVLWAQPGAFRVTVLDDSTYTISYTRDGPGSPLDEWTVYYPRHLLQGLDPKDFASWEFWHQPVGNGPYRLLRRVPQTMVELEANPSFYRTPPAIDRLVLKFGPPQITELLSGAVDVVSYANPTDVLRVGEDPRFASYYALQVQNGDVIAWNQRRPPFGDARVRRALTHAINRRELLQTLNFPDPTPIVDGKFTERQWRRGELPEPLAYDTAMARRLLREAGWGERKLSFMALVPAMFQLERAAVYVQERLRRIGVQMTIERVDFSLVRRRLASGDYDAVFLRMPLSGEWAGLRFLEAGSPLGYANPRVASLLDRIRGAVAPDDQDRLHRELVEILQADVPMTHLAPGVSFTLADRRVRGLSSPFRADPFVAAGELTLAPER